MPHLLVDVSAHGFGHMAQVVPVLRALRPLRPGLRVTIRSAVPASVWRPWLWPQVASAAPVEEPVLAMASATEVQVEASLAAYRALLSRWTEVVAREAARLRTLRPDLVLADVPFVSVAAARRVGIPALAMSSLNWASVVSAYAPQATDVIDALHEAYAGAQAFIRVTPGIATPWMPVSIDAGPVALVGSRQTDTVRRRLGLPAATRLALLAMGGIPTGVPDGYYPARRGWHWLVPRALVTAHRDDVSAVEDLGLGYRDALASSDVVLTKPGYGTFVEAACSGCAVIYQRRPDWPEEPALSDWLHGHARATGLHRAQLLDGQAAPALDALCAAVAPPRPQPTGNAEVAALIDASLA